MESSSPLAGSHFCEDLGIELISYLDGKAIIALTVQPRMTNRFGMAHGGIVSTLADQAMGLAWRSAAPDRKPAGTINLNVNFIAPAKGRLRAEANVVKIAGRCAFCEGHIYGEDGSVISSMQGTFGIRSNNAG